MNLVSILIVSITDKCISIKYKHFAAAFRINLI